MAPPISEDERCEGGMCGPQTSQTWYCSNCDTVFCDVCWQIQIPHKKGKLVDGMPHEKTDQKVVKKLKAILEPPGSQEELRELHRQDEDTTWFGVIRNPNPDPITGLTRTSFKDYGRYAALMAETRPPNGELRYPQLVSFIGQTNAGKSTLIKMLIAHEQRKLPPTYVGEFPSPVVGAARNDKLPTSGDVHLYSDPGTCYGELPMLYADCEGLDGGEEAPLATQSRTQSTSRPRNRPKQFIQSKLRELEWAKDGVTSGREYAVKHLYPRLLYTFSDVIVFVLRNPKTFQSVALRLLLDWAASSLEKSINQPGLPHAIIALNATDPAVPEDEWDVEKATENLIAHVRHSIKLVPAFNTYAEIWRRKGKRIDTMTDLIHCYYSSITVVRIPAKGRYMLIDQQIEKLHQQISIRCDAAFYAKERMRMLPSADELNTYLQAGFNHFSKRLDVPFNFIEIAVRNNPVPQNFGGHVLNLAAAIQRNREYDDPAYIFEHLSPLVASCILLDCVRQRRPGSVEDFFDNYHSKLCKSAVDQFCDVFLPCSYRDYRGRACVNVKSLHTQKGHQDERGKIIGQGTYRSNFSSDAYYAKWQKLLRQHITAAETRLQEKRHSTGASQFRISEVEDAFELHQQYRVKPFFQGKAKKYISLATCYCCLMHVPEHPLLCGHVLCTDCVKNYGKNVRNFVVMMKSCPLHPGETRGMRSGVIHFKPDFAGVRILSLDGGGMRGIVELEVLKAIEKDLGGNIKIQNFFDLIVGTSTGGIIALGLGAKHWSVSTCIKRFTDLCNKAFTPREFSQVAGVRTLVTLEHGSKYRTRPLYSALQHAFGDQYLFGGLQESPDAYATKVAVTSTSGTGQQPIAVSNYGRQEDSSLSYRLEFSNGSGLGMKVWEAACATSAAPSYFKPFTHLSTDRTYMDGALYHNNPVRVANHERKAIWPDVAENHPDVFLSIGTGQNLQQIKEQIQSGAKAKSLNEKRKSATKYGRGDMQSTRRRGLFQTVKNFFSVLMNHMDSVLDSEIAWKEFYSQVLGPTFPEDKCGRYIRINPDLGYGPPALDDKARMLEVQAAANTALKSHDNQVKIQDIAHRLVASTFYFQKSLPKQNETDDAWYCEGAIVCRFDNGSTFLRDLGRIFKSVQTAEFQPHFLVTDKEDESLKFKIELTPEHISNMVDRSIFDLGRLQVNISSRTATTTIYLCLPQIGLVTPKPFPISGFPRNLATEDSLKEQRLERQKTLERSRRQRYERSAFSENDVAAPQEMPEVHSRSASEPKLVNSLLTRLNTSRSRSISRQRSGILGDQANSTGALGATTIEESSSRPEVPESEMSDLTRILADARFMGANLSSANEWRNSMESTPTSRPSPSPRNSNFGFGATQSQQASQQGSPRVTPIEASATDGNDSDDDRLAQMYYTSTYGEDNGPASSHSAPPRSNTLGLNADSAATSILGPNITSSPIRARSGI